MLLLSVIVPVHDVEAYLPRCLHSLSDQDLDPGEYEVIVIDDGSRDGSLAIAEELSRANPTIVVYRQENQGPSAARNRGIDLARGKYVYFVDADDHIASRVLGDLIRVMERETLQVLAFTFADVGPNDYLDRPRMRPDLSRDVDVVPGMAYLAAHQYSNTVWWYMVSRAFLIDLGLRFEVGGFVADVVFTATVISAADRFAFVPLDVYRHARRSGSIIETRTDAQHTTKLVVDYERTVFGLEGLRQRLLKSGTASTALSERLVNRQQSFVFFLIGRLIRSDVPIRPILPEAFERLRAIDMYPLTHFPGRDDPGVRYRLLTAVFNRGYLLYPFVRVYRWGRRWRGRSPA